MGTSNSRAKIRKVTPKEEPSFLQAASPEIITAAQHQQEIPGHQHHQLPPIKQHLPQIVPSPPDSQNLYAKPICSIIKSHPPQRAKIWQPIACPMEPPGVLKAYNKHASMKCKGGFLQAQTFLMGEATKKRHSYQRRLRDQRKIYTSTVGNVQLEGIRLVSRPTQRDIFWDETEGQILDLRDLLQQSPPLTDPDAGMKERTSRLKSELGQKDNFSRDLNKSGTKSPERITQQNLPWPEGFQKNESKHLETWDILEGKLEPKLCLDTPWKYREKEDSELGWNISGQANTVNQKWNSWYKDT